MYEQIPVCSACGWLYENILNRCKTAKTISCESRSILPFCHFIVGAVRVMFSETKGDYCFIVNMRANVEGHCRSTLSCGSDYDPSPFTNGSMSFLTWGPHFEINAKQLTAKFATSRTIAWNRTKHHPEWVKRCADPRFHLSTREQPKGVDHLHVAPTEPEVRVATGGNIALCGMPALFWCKWYCCSGPLACW